MAKVIEKNKIYKSDRKQEDEDEIFYEELAIIGGRCNG